MAKYLHKTVQKGIVPKDVTLLLTKCFGEEYNSFMHDCFHCQVKNRCRYVETKGIKKKLLEKYKDKIQDKIKELTKAEKKAKQKRTVDEKKEYVKALEATENALKKQLRKESIFGPERKEIEKEFKEVQKKKKVLNKFFK